MQLGLKKYGLTLGVNVDLFCFHCLKLTFLITQGAAECRYFLPNVDLNV